MIICGTCDRPVEVEYGLGVCPKCGVLQCVEFCIPGGNNALCVSCEESQH